MRRAWVLLVLAACSSAAAPAVQIPSTPLPAAEAVQLATDVCDEMRAEVFRHEAEVQASRSFASIMPVMEVAIDKLGSIRSGHETTQRALRKLSGAMGRTLDRLREADPLLSSSTDPANEPEVRAFEAAKQEANAAARAAGATSCEISP